jgi:AcrR family transcriptional regulator
MALSIKKPETDGWGVSWRGLHGTALQRPSGAFSWLLRSPPNGRRQCVPGHPPQSSDPSSIGQMTIANFLNVVYSSAHVQPGGMELGIAERREREKEALRTRIVEAARDIISEAGLDALSMRSIAERIEYSPGTIYLYFRDKEELLGEVIEAGFERMGGYIAEELAAAGKEADAARQHRALGRAYARFALENTAYFRVMFELPSVPQVECRECPPEEQPGHSGTLLVETIQRAMDAGLYQLEDAETGALIAWGLIHGLTSLYVSGHCGSTIPTHEAFLTVVEKAMDSLGRGWVPRETVRREAP